ncbi:MAG: hypothetical protein CM1200mP26_12010 [Acidimicrobiales bacterium]|nr:MAG: hypothetical protein CM1200mP26_12010 [Acidimicrobiales bacterium]
MSLQFSSADLEAQDRLRRAFDPEGLANPAKVYQAGRVAGTCPGLDRAPEGTGCERLDGLP